jgi:hypothetical protein
MPLTSIFRGEHLEPPPWLYARLAQGSLMRLIYRLFVADLAGGPAPGDPAPPHHIFWRAELQGA